jgi:hypothetical protein
MLPLILLAVGTYIIGDAVLEDDKYAKGGMMKGRKPDYESKKGEELTKKAKELWNSFDEEQRMSFLYYQTGFRTTDGRYDDDIKKQAKNNWDDLAVRIQMIVEESIYFSDMAKGGDVEGKNIVILKEAFFQGGKNGSKAAMGKDFETYQDWIKKNKIKSHKLYEKAFQDGGKSAFNNMKGRDFQTFEEWEKENIDKMAKGGKTQGYDDREDERLAMQRGKIAKKDLKSTHARRDDARFEERGK